MLPPWSVMTNGNLAGSSLLLTRSFQSTQTESSIQLQSLPGGALRPLAPGVTHLPSLLAPPDLWSLFHLKNITPRLPCVLPQRLTLQNPSLPQIPLFHFCHTHPWLQSHPPSGLQAAPRLSTGVIPCCRVPMQLSLPSMLGPRLPTLSRRRPTSPSAPPCPVLLPEHWAPWGMWTPVLSPGEPLALQWVCGKWLHMQKMEHFPSRLAKVAHRIFSNLSEWLFQLALGYPTNTAVFGFDLYF